MIAGDTQFIPGESEPTPYIARLDNLIVKRNLLPFPMEVRVELVPMSLVLNPSIFHTSNPPNGAAPVEVCRMYSAYTSDTYYDVDPMETDYLHFSKNAAKNELAGKTFTVVWLLLPSLRSRAHNLPAPLRIKAF